MNNLSHTVEKYKQEMMQLAQKSKTLKPHTKEPEPQPQKAEPLPPEKLVIAEKLAFIPPLPKNIEPTVSTYPAFEDISKLGADNGGAQSPNLAPSIDVWVFCDGTNAPIKDANIEIKHSKSGYNLTVSHPDYHTQTFKDLPLTKNKTEKYVLMIPKDEQM